MTGIHWASFRELELATLYALLQLRVDVFVVEQHCPYRDLDGRDTEEGTRFAWVEEGGAPVAALRVLEEDAAVRIGRVATTPAQRGRGLAAELVHEALARTRGPVMLDAQIHLREYYEGLGFMVSGADFVEDGIVHVPMRLEREA